MSSLGRAAHVGFLCAAREGVCAVLPLARARGRESGQEERKPERKEVGGDVSAESGEAALQTDEKDSAKTAQDPNCCTVGVAQGGGGLGGVKEERGRWEVLVGTEMLPCLLGFAVGLPGSWTRRTSAPTSPTWP